MEKGDRECLTFHHISLFQNHCNKLQLDLKSCNLLTKNVRVDALLLDRGEKSNDDA